MKARCLLLASLVTLAGCNSTNSHTPAPSNELLVRDSYSCPVPAETGGALSLNNTSGKYLTVYVADKEGYAYQVIERVGSPSVRQWNAKLKDGTYHLVCVFRNTSSIAGAEFEVTGSPYKEASKMLPITEDDVAKASVAHAAQQHGELAQWAGLDDALLLATQSGDREAAKKAWLAAYRKYRTFDDSNTEWEGPVDDIGDFGTSATPTPEDIEGYHRVEWGLWHGEAMPEVAQHAQFLNDNVHTVVEGVGQFALASADYGLRTHEMTEELERFDLQGYRDYGSNSLPLAVQADMEATRTMIDPLRDILAQRGANLAEIDKSLDKVEDFSQTMDPHDPTDRQVLNGFVADANEKLAVIATMTVIRRM